MGCRSRRVWRALPWQLVKNAVITCHRLNRLNSQNLNRFHWKYSGGGGANLTVKWGYGGTDKCRVICSWLDRGQPWNWGCCSEALSQNEAFFCFIVANKHCFFFAKKILYAMGIAAVTEKQHLSRSGTKTLRLTWSKRLFGKRWREDVAVFFSPHSISFCYFSLNGYTSTCPSGRTKPCNWLLPHLSPWQHNVNNKLMRNSLGLQIKTISPR